MLNVTCRDLEESIKEILEPIVQDFQTTYPYVEGEAYLGYPIYFNKGLNSLCIAVDSSLVKSL